MTLERLMGKNTMKMSYVVALAMQYQDQLFSENGREVRWGSEYVSDSPVSHQTHDVEIISWLTLIFEIDLRYRSKPCVDQFIEISRRKKNMLEWPGSVVTGFCQ